MKRETQSPKDQLPQPRRGQTPVYQGGELVSYIQDRSSPTERTRPVDSRTTTSTPTTR